ncbi:MAG: thioredoxin family protein [Proteobacteria bacterium]|nr:thioredoxin family protein [Pseudomonadota bacterium]
MQDWSPNDLKVNLEKGHSIFLKLWKKGCGACKLAIPATDRLEASNEHNMTFAQISTDDYPEILEIADTEVLPMFFVFVGGEMKGRLEGFKGLDKLKSMVEESFRG